jgi:hypothetical protein
VAASTRIQLGVPAARFFRERKEVEKKEITDILSFFSATRRSYFETPARAIDANFIQVMKWETIQASVVLSSYPI